MDDTDLLLCRALMQDARKPYSELAEELGISVPAVHHRIQALMEAGIVVGFSAQLSDEFLGAIPLAVSGQSRLPVEKVVENLKKGDSTSYVGFSGRGFVYLIAILRSVSETEGYLAWLRDAAGIMEPGVGVGATNATIAGMSRPAGKRNPPKLSSLDYKIIRALRDDARKPVAEVAKELGKSAKTVRAHLERMIEANVIQFGLRWRPTMAMGMNSYIMIRLKSNADRGRVVNAVTILLGPKLIMLGTAGNLPNLLLCVAWVPTGAAQGALASSLAVIDGVEEIQSDTLHTSCTFRTWKDAILEERVCR
jgi:DNA-binding Lrp family transcriptional regulator